MKIVGSGLNLTSVPVESDSPMMCNSSLGFPFSNCWKYFLPLRLTVTSKCSDKAFTTEAPTPCNPPETLYPPPPNFPPACKTV